MPFGIISATRRLFERFVEQDARMRDLVMRKPDETVDGKDEDPDKLKERELFYWGVFPIL